MKLNKPLSGKAKIEKVIERAKRRDEVFALMDKQDLMHLTEDEIRAALQTPKAKREAGSADARAG